MSHPHIYYQWKDTLLDFSVILLAFESALLKMNPPLIDCTFITTQRDHVRVRKILLNKDIVQITPISVNGRRCLDAEMNAEFFKCSYCL